MTSSTQSPVPTRGFAYRRCQVGRCDWRRGLAGLLAVFALILQLLAPGVARATNGEWVEICSEIGPVLMQIDVSGDETDQNSPCPKCKTCTLCAAAVPFAPKFGAPVLTNNAEPRDLSLTDRRIDLPELRYQRPLTRGPPSATLDMTDRARSASMAMFCKIGDTPWT